MSPRAEDGLTLVEVLVAVLLLAVGAVGVLAATGAGARTSVGSDRAQLAGAFAQRELERLSALAATPQGYASLGLAALPQPGVDATPGDAAPSTPAAYLAGCGAGGCTALRMPQDPARRAGALPAGVAGGGEPLVAGGSEAAVQSVVLEGRVDATLHRYVTWVAERCVQDGGSVACPPVGQAKRITVALVLAGRRADGVTKPVWATTVVTDPAVVPLGMAT